MPDSAKKDAEESMPRTPSKWFSSEQVYQVSSVDFLAFVTDDAQELGDDDNDENDAMEPLDDDIYLPYRDRKSEAMEVFNRPQNKALIGLLQRCVCLRLLFVASG